jgi:hypothetical protein
MICRAIGRAIFGEAAGGEICIEHGETTFFVDELPILSIRGNRRLGANTVWSALNDSRKKI